MMPCYFRKIPAGQNHQHVDSPQLRAAVGQRPDAIDDVVDLRESLEIRIQAVGKERVEHVAEDLPKRRRQWRDCGRTYVVAGTDHEEALRPKMNGGAERIRLAHCAIAVVLLPEQHGRKQKRHGDARHQMVERQRASFA